MKRHLILSSLLLGIQSILLSQTKIDTLFFHSDGWMITGYFYPSPDRNSPVLLFTQGFMETGDIWGIGQTLSQAGINVFTFDFRGCFNSEGQQGILNSQIDIGSALALIKTSFIADKYDIDTSAIVVGGYSWGGHMSLLFAINNPDVKKVITISGGDLGIFAERVKANPSLRQNYLDFFHSIRQPKGPVVFQYDDPIQELIDNQEDLSILNQIQKLSNVDIFLTGALDDRTVSMEDYILPMYRSLKGNSSINLECRIYQTDHSYIGESQKLLQDLINYIKP